MVTPAIPEHAPETILLAPSATTARWLRQSWYRRQIEAGAAVFASPAIQTLPVLLKQLWQQVPVSGDFSRPVLLTAGQELAVWQNIVQASTWSGVLLQAGSLARSASQACRQMHDWQIPLNKLKDFTLDESRALKEWCEAFDRSCRQNHWLPEWRLGEYLAQLPPGVIDSPRHIVVYGSDELPPAQQSVLEWLVEVGSQVEPARIDESNRQVFQTTLADAGQEYRYAASWAKARLASSPTASVAIALADPGRASELIRVIDRVLDPQRLYRATSERPYLSTQPGGLDSLPMVDAALRILGQSHYRVDLAELGQIIRSVFVVDGDKEMLARAQFDAHLRQLGELTPSLGYVAAQILDKESGEYRFACPRLYEALHNWRRAIDAMPKTQMPSEWAADFSGLLAAMGWPGEGVVDGDLMNRWNDALSSLCALDAVCSPQDRDSALRWLRRIVGDMPAPIRSGVARLHIIGINDAAHVGFDHLWICGLDDDTWPPPARPNPLLPIALQRDAGIPGASSVDVGERAHRLLQQAQKISSEVVFSYSRMEGDRELRPCPFIQDVDTVAPDELAAVEPSMAEVLFHGSELELVADETDALLPDQARGGTAIIKSQAACPFRAYVDHRLAAVSPEEPEPGLDASERGTLLHEVLETVWATLGSHAGLVEADEAERERLVFEAAKLALEKMVWKKPETITPKFLEIEIERLVTRVMAWLSLEQGRDSFTVLKPEVERTFELAGLNMKMRIDRIDQTAIGERIIIDYKTGSASVSSWFGDRPDEPQLPLYALTETAAGHEVAAIAFAQVRPNELAFKGVSKDEAVLPDVKPVNKHSKAKEYGDWQALLEHWRATLTRLAQDFVDGVAPVDPKSSNSCQYCEFDGICRINELQQRAGLHVDDGPGGEGGNG